jgi:hypothetical protein
MSSRTQQRPKTKAKTKAKTATTRKQSITKQFRAKAMARAKVLAPQVHEYHELIEFLEMTAPKVAPKPEAEKPKAKAAPKSRSRKRTATKATGKRRGAPPRRAIEFAKLVDENPGMTVREASKRLDGVNETYLHRIGKDLVGDGTLRKEGSGYYPAGNAVVVEAAPVVTETPAMTPVETPEVF